MQRKVSLPHSQAPATRTYSETDQSSPFPPPYLLKITLILSTNQRVGLPSGVFPSGLPTKFLYAPLPSPIRATFPTHLIFLDLGIGFKE